MTKRIVTVLGIALLSSAAAVSAASIAWAAAAPANMRGYMMQTVAPAVQPIWDFSYADKMTAADWTRVQQASANLVRAAAAVTNGGTVAAEQARAKDAKWQDFSKKMTAAATAAQAASGKKDQMALAAAGDSLLEICEGCHMAFDPSAKQ